MLRPAETLAEFSGKQPTSIRFVRSRLGVNSDIKDKNLNFAFFLPNQRIYLNHTNLQNSTLQKVFSCLFHIQIVIPY
jgi:hypothetical protein